jgi:ArsR family transcriptional regulator, arsenate/arsenite/antimonite-responsive transcriptional repressor
LKTQSTESCCEPLTAAALTEPQAVELAAAFKALADPARLRLFSMVASIPDGEACACDLVGPIGRSQPTVSHHLSILVEAGLLSREQRGKWAYYQVVPERLTVLRDALAPGG